MPPRGPRRKLNSPSQEAAVALAEAEAVPAAAEERQSIYYTDALHDKPEDISWTAEQPWVETQVVTHTEATQVDSVDDDLARELAFYNQVKCQACLTFCWMAVSTAAGRGVSLEVYLVRQSSLIKYSEQYVAPVIGS